MGEGECVGESVGGGSGWGSGERVGGMGRGKWGKAGGPLIPLNALRALDPLSSLKTT